MNYGTHRLLAGMLACTILAAAPAAAAQLSGEQLLSLCTANMGGAGNPMKAAQCMGFVVGVADTFNCEEDNRGLKWNSEAAGSQPQIVNVVVQYIQDNPTALATGGHIAVGEALSKAYPCPAKTAGN